MMRTTPPTTTTTTASTTPTLPVALHWYTDRSRYEAGTARCPRQRFLGYHFGPSATGITTRSDALPLVTGIYTHRGLEGFAQILQQHDRLPSLEETRGLIRETAEGYLARVEERGYRGILAGPLTDDTIVEQATLIEGLLWSLRLTFLPWLHQRYRVISSEQERVFYLDCACGASPLDPEEHIRRGCTAKALMQRVDLLAEHRVAGHLAYFEGKTTGWESDSWGEQWETKSQLGLGTLDAEQRFGREVAELFIITLNKGRRAKNRYEEDDRKRQNSPLCYGYRRPANPPFAPDDWVWSYEWIDESGAVRRKSKAHRRAGIWELPGSDWPTWRQYKAAKPEMTPVEFWVRMLPPSLAARGR